MKKITLLALACAMFMAPAVANAQEVTYVEDPAQGYTFNRFQDNWFIGAMGGAGIMMSKYDRGVDFGDRIGWKGALVIGKWFSPIVGLRVMGEFNQMKGATYPNYGAMAYRPDMNDKLNGKAGNTFQFFNNIGAAGDAMLNLTNWICGYRPGRFYNAIPYAGASIHWAFFRENNGKGDWKYAGGDGPARNLSLRAGLLNTFAISNAVDILLDLRFEMMQEHVDGAGNRTWVEYPSAMLGLAYKFNKRDWTAPVVPVCPTYKYTDAQGDALVARLQAADRRIADLENQLKNCNKPEPGPKPVEKDAPLATIYFPINVSKIVGVQNDIVDAVANVMLDENKNYMLTGWADNYTGNDQINVRLRKGRVATVKNELVKKGVAESRLETQINNGELTNYGPKCASLDRAVTIQRK